jgi:glycosyltransferase involved in cell wall biosynthesis
MIMSQFGYDVAVAYRIYPKVSTSCGNHPPVFSKDKLKLSELCLKSFKNSLGGLRVKLWVLLDNCPPVYETMFTQLWSPEDLVLMRYPAVGDGATFREQSRILMEQTDAEIIYFAEDDYFYLPDQFHLAVNFLKQNPDADFVAPYQGLGFYTGDMENVSREKREFGGKVWNSCVSTTHTFLGKRAALIESRELFLTSYGRFAPDLAKWMALTKKRVFNPIKFIYWLVPHRFWAGSMVLAWYFCWRQILFGRRYTLWSPYPAIATHMVAGLESPDVDWQKEFQRQMAGVRLEP